MQTPQHNLFSVLDLMVVLEQTQSLEYQLTMMVLVFLSPHPFNQPAGGSGYAVGDTITIAGTQMQPTSPANDLTFVVTKTGPSAVATQQINLIPMSLQELILPVVLVQSSMSPEVLLDTLVKLQLLMVVLVMHLHL